MLVHLILSQSSLKLYSFLFILFSFVFFLCSTAVTSTILSSSSLIHSSASLILLLIPFSVFFSYCIFHSVLYIICLLVEHFLYLLGQFLYSFSKILGPLYCHYTQFFFRYIVCLHLVFCCCSFIWNLFLCHLTLSTFPSL